jgi:hypothetical protein
VTELEQDDASDDGAFGPNLNADGELTLGVCLYGLGNLRAT